MSDNMRRTIITMLKNAAEVYSSKNYLNEKDDSGWKSRTFSESYTDARRFALALINIGLRKNDKIAILSEARNNWIIGELGTIIANCVSVPLSIKLLPSEVIFRINHCEAKAIIVSQNNIDKVFSVFKDLINKNIKIIYLDNDISYLNENFSKYEPLITSNLLYFNDLLNSVDLTQVNSDKIKEYESLIEEDDVVTISYTSGTSGDPKGIMLTHLNYYSNCRDSISVFKIPENFSTLLILPVDHSFTHTIGIYASLLKGISLFFVDARGGNVYALKNIPVNLKEASPDFLLTVPALTKNFMNRIKDGVKSKNKLVQFIFNTGLKSRILSSGNGYAKTNFAKKIILYIPYKIADILVFRKIRSIFGSKLKFFVGGGALLDYGQQEFFNAIGIPVYQGYGLTEASPVISANSPHKHKFGSSGILLPSIKCKIIDKNCEEKSPGEKGEITIYGDNVMKGYFKNTEATNSALIDGWLRTGDLGYIDKDSFLVVSGREKALLISEDGEKYSPEEIEESITNNLDIIAQVMLYNEQKKYTTALITLNKEKVNEFISSNKIENPEELLKSIKESIKHINKNKFPEKWLPSTFQIIEEPFSEGNRMINSTMKMVRYKIVENYLGTINYMYTSEGSPITNKNNKEIIEKMFNSEFSN
jgi:long-chain acyl-CoA synthetase